MIQWGDVGTWVQATGVLIAAVIAVFQVSKATRAIEAAEKASARQSVDEQAALRARMRPYIVIEFEAERIEKIIHLEVTNVGATPAIDVMFTFDPSLIAAQDRDLPTWAVGDVRWLKDGIATLAPARRLRTIFDTAIDREHLRQDGDPVPDTFDVTVTYRGGIDPTEQYQEAYRLDVESYRGSLYVSIPDLSDLVKSTDSIAKSVDGVRTQLRDLHPVVETRADWKRRSDDERRAHEARSEAARRPSNPT